MNETTQEWLSQRLNLRTIWKLLYGERKSCSEAIFRMPTPKTTAIPSGKDALLRHFPLFHEMELADAQTVSFLLCHGKVNKGLGASNLHDFIWKMNDADEAAFQKMYQKNLSLLRFHDYSGLRHTFRQFLRSDLTDEQCVSYDNRRNPRLNRNYRLSEAELHLIRLLQYFLDAATYTPEDTIQADALILTWMLLLALTGNRVGELHAYEELCTYYDKFLLEPKQADGVFTVEDFTDSEHGKKFLYAPSDDSCTSISFLDVYQPPAFFDSRIGETSPFSFEEFLDKFLSDDTSAHTPSRHVLTVLGKAAGGKSTLMRYLSHEATLRNLFLKHGYHRIRSCHFGNFEELPIDWTDARHSLIPDLMRACGFTVTEENELIREEFAHTLLILDAFDEVSTSADRCAVLRQLQSYFNSHEELQQFRLIITCRKSYLEFPGASLNEIDYIVPDAPSVAQRNGFRDKYVAFINSLGSMLYT